MGQHRGLCISRVWRRACNEPAGMMRKDGISDAKYASLPLTVA